MGRRKPAATPPAEPPTEEPARLDEQSLEILLKEYDALRELFSQAESGVQSIFNFYLTLASTIGGAIVVIWQVTRPDSTQGVHSSLLITAGLLLFVAMIGSVYLSSITGRYAHMSRYAQGIDQLRRYLLSFTGGAYPAIYRIFMQQPDRSHLVRQDRAVRAILWLSPTGTYQLFVAAVNSLSLTGAVWLFLSATSVTVEAPARSIVACLVIAVVSYVLYNVYSRYVMIQLVTRLNIQVDSSREAPFITGKH
jgi:hypothetical protein